MSTVTEAQVELAERYAAALKSIEEAPEITESDVELAERYAAALQAIREEPEIDLGHVELAERGAASNMIKDVQVVELRYIETFRANELRAIANYPRISPTDIEMNVLMGAARKLEGMEGSLGEHTLCDLDNDQLVKVSDILQKYRLGIALRGIRLA